MKQVLQSLKTGRTEVADVPCPAVRRGQVLIRTAATLVSAGTERMLIEFGKANLLEKARQQPDRVKQVLDKIKTDGLMPTIETVFNKLDQPLPLGYCNVGVVVDVGPGVSRFAIGERVVSNGKHAEAVSVPVNLCAKVPAAVTDAEAAFTVLGAIALQGVRLVEPTLGETVVVTGLGLVGLLTVQLLRANGCRVLGIDFDRAKLDLARGFGAEVVDLSAGEDPIASASVFSRGAGVDAVIITASTKSSEPVHQAALMCRKRGRIVLVGVTGLELARADFYEKELSFQVSCSYGPGRYEPDYEERGLDYPPGFVRWTEQRNFEAVLDMMADRRIDVRPLISHRFPIADAVSAYGVVTGADPSLGILLDYPGAEAQPLDALRRAVVDLPANPASTRPGVGVGFIGSGNYAGAVLIPAFKAAGARLGVIVSSNGASGVHAGRKFGFAKTATDVGEVFGDSSLQAAVIATRHDSHAALVCQALAAGKHVFVEKPLALTNAEVDDVSEALASAPGRHLMVGFNRRFAPQVVKMRALLDAVKEPKAIVMTVNAGAIPPSHWAHDVEMGGGRILGEGCHFIDLLRHLAGAPIAGFQVDAIPGTTGTPPDRATISLRFADGSIGTVHYLANGHKSFPKERVDVFAGGRVLQLDNFRRLSAFGWPDFKRMNLWRQDKGQNACAAAFVNAAAGNGPAPIPHDELFEVSRVTIAVSEALERVPR